MGIFFDIILVGIVVLSAYLGYKKGLVKLGARLFAGIIAIVLTIMLYNPISSLIIEKTQIDENIENVFLEHATKLVSEDKHSDNFEGKVISNVNKQIRDETLPSQANRLSKYAVYVISALIIFIFVKIVLSIVFSILGFIAELPILKQFNEIGGGFMALLEDY